MSRPPVGLALAVFLNGALAAPAWADLGVYEQTLGQILVAAKIYNACDDLEGIQPGKAYLEGAAQLAAKQQGLRKQKLLKTAYYGGREAILSAVSQEMTRRGISDASTASLCAFGQKVAGTNDAIGRFLVKR